MQEGGRTLGVFGSMVLLVDVSLISKFEKRLRLNRLQHFDNSSHEETNMRGNARFVLLSVTRAWCVVQIHVSREDNDSDKRAIKESCTNSTI